jgi:disulfide bond formation protein DsbB
MYPIEFYNQWLGIGTLVLEIFTAAFLVLYFMRARVPDLEAAARLLSGWGLWIGFVLTISATAATLFYSEILGLAPCGWCWFQRIFLYPQAVIFAIALYKNERAAADYSIGLSIVGGAIALYQHYLQMGGSALIGCPSNPGPADCAQRFMFELNYITFPLAAFSLFSFLIVLMLFVRQRT